MNKRKIIIAVDKSMTTNAHESTSAAAHAEEAQQTPRLTVKSRTMAHEVKLSSNQDLAQLNHNRKLAAQLLLQDNAQRKHEKVSVNQLLSNAVGKVGSNSVISNTLLVWDKELKNLEYQ